MELEEAKKCLKEIQKVSIENDKKAIEVGLKPKYLYWNKSIETALQALDNSISKDKVREMIKRYETYLPMSNTIVNEYIEAEMICKIIKELQELLEDK